MAATPRMLAGTKESGDVGEFVYAAAASIECMQNMCGANEIFDYRHLAFASTIASTVIPLQVLNASAASTPVAAAATILVDVVVAFDVEAPDDQHNAVAIIKKQALRERVHGVPLWSSSSTKAAATLKSFEGRGRENHCR